MRVSFDPRYNIAYLKFRDKAAEVTTVKVSEALNIDLAPDGTIYGIELLNANEQLRGKDAGRLILTNEATGKVAEVVLP